ncbi:uncharacterized protein LOC143302000 [Babylonia areolata]|uniref:uncharacterized protein LOC143302000 n=1 Tax=Babylonia areolata TaxID=304850 RepID=UPI003FD4DDF3
MTSPFVTGSDDNVTAESGTDPDGCVVFPFSTFAPWLQPEDLVSFATQQAFNRFTNVYLLTVLLFVSVPCNVVNLIVFWKHGLKERINLCMFCLALADLLTVAPHFVWNFDGLYSEISGAPYRFLVMKVCVNTMVHSLAGFIYVSGFLCTLIALERCLCVLSPLKAQSSIPTSAAAVIIGVGHVVIFAGHYIIATRWRVVCMFDPLTAQTKDVFYSSEFYLRNKSLVDFMDGIIFGIVLPGLYVAGVSISTVITVLKLKEMAQWRDRSSSTASTGTGNATKDVSLTRMLIGISCLFVACTTPPLVLHAALPFVPDLGLSGKFYNTYYLFINIQQLLTYINASVNFFVYYPFGTKFRRTVQSMFSGVFAGCNCLRRKAKTYSESESVRPANDLSSVSQSTVKTAGAKAEFDGKD